MFNRVQRRFGNGVVYPQVATTGLATSTHQVLDLQPGDVVRVRAKHEIERTLTASYKNRGLWFDAEMLRFCGGEYRVSARVDRLIEEKSGKLITLSSPCVILDGGGDRGVRRAIGQHQNDSGSSRIFRAALSASGPSFEVGAFIGGHTQRHMASEYITIESMGTVH
jgi:hypothetical protein